MSPQLDLIDSHAHLDFDRLAPELDSVLDRAWAAGVRQIVTIGAGRGAEGAYDAVALAARQPRVWATVGVHPHDADLGVTWQGDPGAPVAPGVRREWEGACEQVLRRLESLSLHPRVVAIGEVGLDFHYDHSPRELQRELFRRLIRLAIGRGLPLVLHAREAEDELAAILIEEGAQRVGGVVHCFSGHAGLMRTGLELGFCFGLTGVLTFSNAVALRQAVAGLPLERLLVETDSPYLAPVPYRGKRNEPAYVLEVARKLAEVKGVALDQVAAVTSANARRVFGLDRREAAARRAPGAIAYRLGDGVYLNITNRCTQACCFCLKRSGHELAGIRLDLWTEPSAQQVLAAVDEQLAAAPADEVVFCGIGEPLLRPELVIEAGRVLRARGIRVRLNTDGLASLVHGRDVAADLVGAIDAVSVSLNGHDAATHARLCPSVFGPEAFEAVCSFVRRSVELFDEVTASVVASTGVDIEAARRLALGLGARFRVRG